MKDLASITQSFISLSIKKFLSVQVRVVQRAMWMQVTNMQFSELPMIMRKKAPIITGIFTNATCVIDNTDVAGKKAVMHYRHILGLFESFALPGHMIS